PSGVPALVPAPPVQSLDRMDLSVWAYSHDTVPCLSYKRRSRRLHPTKEGVRGLSEQSQCRVEEPTPSLTYTAERRAKQRAGDVILGENRSCTAKRVSRC